MSQSTNDAPKQQEKPKKKISIPLITFILTFTLKYLGIFVGAGFTCLVIEYVIYGWETLNGIQSLDRSFENFSVAIGATDHLGKWIDVQGIYEIVVTWLTEQMSYLFQLFSNMGSVSNTMSRAVDHYRDLSVNNVQPVEVAESITTEVLYIWLLSTLTWFIKLLTLTSYLPLYILVAASGLIDGMVERKKRMYTGVPDSSDRTEWWYRKARLVSLTVMFTYFVLPHSWHPALFFIPSVLLSAYVVRKLAMNFKVYW
ncbi:DUF4400 domain-containing protein [Vibrio agarivorans]|uniref:DUF4400 domain-containing protein n=1 Tax=Vibrio agarivorans TaxID=153622 RepID=A0ABT7Y7K8_9VIBR|nr:DUF4400 domain-containing protein [Vibrio agarivorans]MDN2483935.1 DUF4400 domain-containing protein [Vibrio agarivorans]